jgi:hypothetical protein
VLTLAHLVNPVTTAAGSDLAMAQPITFASIRQARDFARDSVRVNLLSAQFAEDRPAVPTDFSATPDLNRSVADLAGFATPRKLPLLRDLLQRLYDHANCDYLMYSNVDIALMPYFYSAIQQIAAHGYDAFVVNRRTIPATFNTSADLPSMYSQLGQPHPGWDCFVFKRDLFPRFVLGNACIGIPRVGLTLICNLICFASHFQEIKDAHLTFHVGNAMSWNHPDLADYKRHNTTEFLASLQALAQWMDYKNPQTPLGGFLTTLKSERCDALRDLFSSLEG